MHRRGVVRWLIGVLTLAICCHQRAVCGLSHRRRVFAAAKGEERYFIHIPLYGPNNQLTGLKEVLALAKLLDRTVLMHGVFLHYSDVGLGPSHDFKESWSSAKWLDPEQFLTPTVPMFDIYDRDRLSKFSKVLSLEEFKAGGWDGRLDAFVRFTGEWHQKYMRRMEITHGLTTTGAMCIVASSPLEKLCDGLHLGALHAALAQHRVVAVAAYESVVAGAGHGLEMRLNGQLCHDTYLNVSRNLLKGSKLRALADRFVLERLGGGPYAAIHVRPYPDNCVRYVWVSQQPYDDRNAQAHCYRDTENMYRQVVPYTRQRMGEHGLTHLFAMAPPAMRPNLTALFQAAGVEPVYYDEKKFVQETGWQGATMLSMLEVEISSNAAVFIGTLASSMTGSIIQERVMKGNDAGGNKTMSFPKDMYAPPTVTAAPAAGAVTDGGSQGTWLRSFTAP